MGYYYIMGGGNSAGKTTRLIKRAKRLIEEGKSLKLVVRDDLVDKVIGMGIPAENIQTLSETYHAKTQRVFDVAAAEEVKPVEETTEGAA